MAFPSRKEFPFHATNPSACRGPHRSPDVPKFGFILGLWPPEGSWPVSLAANPSELISFGCWDSIPWLSLSHHKLFKYPHDSSFLFKRLKPLNFKLRSARLIEINLKFFLNRMLIQFTRQLESNLLGSGSDETYWWLYVSIRRQNLILAAYLCKLIPVKTTSSKVSGFVVRKLTELKCRT